MFQLISVSYIWSGDRSPEGKQADREATGRLIELLSESQFAEMLKDNKTKKSKVWHLIAQTLTDEGHVLEKDKGVVKVDQKYRNIERAYKDYVQYQSKTGRGKKPQPEFYEELHVLFGRKHTVNPPAVVDTNAQPLCAPQEVPQLEDRCKQYTTSETPTKKKPKKFELHELLQEMREEQRNNKEIINKHIEEMNTKLEEAREEERARREKAEREDKEQFEEIKKMHKERMEMQRALLSSLSALKK